MKIQQVDGLEWVRSREKQLFATGRIDAMALIAYVMVDVLEIGRGSCRIAGCDSWWFVSSDVDWLRHPDLGVIELFQRVVVAPDHGEHSLRAESLMNAFATDVVTEGADGRVVIKGTPPSDDGVARAVDCQWSRRFIAFRL